MCLDQLEIERLLRGEKASGSLRELRNHSRECSRCATATEAAAERVLLERAALEGGHLDSLSLSRYLDEDAPPALRMLLEIHLRACDHCRERLEAMREERERTHAEPVRAVAYEPFVVPASERRAGLSLPFRMALAAGCAAVLLFAVSRFPFNAGSGPSGGPAQVASRTPAAAVPVRGETLLQDGPVRLALADGELQVGVFDPQAQALYREILPGGELHVPAGVRRYVVRGPGAPASPAADPTSPEPDQVLRRPSARFRWSAAAGEKHALEVYAAERKSQPVRRVTARGAEAEIAGLEPGAEYTWLVTSEDTGEEVVSERAFRVLDAAAAAEIERLEAAYPEAHLLRGSAYLKHGLVAEALEEYRKAADAQGGKGPAERIYRSLREALEAQGS